MIQFDDLFDIEFLCGFVLMAWVREDGAGKYPYNPPRSVPPSLDLVFFFVNGLGFFQPSRGGFRVETIWVSGYPPGKNH